MAEEGNGRERLDLKVGGQSVGLATKDLIPILLVLLIGAGGYFAYLASTSSQNERFARMQEQHVMLFRQHQQLHEAIGQQNETIRRWLITVDYNIAHPEERLPLEVAPPLPPAPVMPVPPAKE